VIDDTAIDVRSSWFEVSIEARQGDTLARARAPQSRQEQLGIYFNDHLAGATGCPTVGVYGWTDPAEWRPVGRCVRGVRAADGRLESVEPREVIDAVLPLLAGEQCAVG